jgi:hypothetical protein
MNNPYTQTPYGNRVTVQLVEAGLQSYSDRKGARHHFEFQLTYPTFNGLNPTMLTAAPLSGNKWDTFMFTEPLKDVHGLTLVFRNPDVPINFLPDCFYDAVIGDDGSVAPAPGHYVMVTVNGHGLLVGDRVHISGFASGNDALDVYINREDGHVASAQPGLAPFPITGEPIPTVNQFWLDPAPSLIDLTAPPPVIPQIAVVYVAKRRLRIPLRLRRVVDRLTNYVNL